MGHHLDEHRQYVIILPREFGGPARVDVTARDGEGQPSLSRCGLGVGVRQPINEGSSLSAFSPGLGDVRTDRTGRSSDLIRERILFFLRESFCDFKYHHRSIESKLINTKILVGLDGWHSDPLCSGISPALLLNTRAIPIPTTYPATDTPSSHSQRSTSPSPHRPCPRSRRRRWRIRSRRGPTLRRRASCCRR